MAKFGLEKVPVKNPEFVSPGVGNIPDPENSKDPEAGPGGSKCWNSDRG